MTSDLVIITPELSPGCGGVADHTLALLQEWGTPEMPAILVAHATNSGKSGANVQQLGLTLADISSQLPKTGGRIFVQYSAYGFNRFGYPRDLIRALIDWRKRVNNGSLVVMFHEIWAFWSFVNKNFIVQQLHRRSLKRLLGVCDAVFTTTVSQRQHLQSLRPAVAIEVLPVGSNVRPGELKSGGRDKSLAVLFGLQFSRIRALEQMQGKLADLASAGCIKRIATVGHGSSEDANRRERELLERLNLPAGFTQHGALAELKVSEVLNSASFGIFGQNELSCQKSGSFMAYAAHQLNVIADFAQPTKPPPVCWLVAPLELLEGIAQGELDRRAKCLRMWQEENCSWEVIGNKVGRALGIKPVQSSNH